MGPTGTGKTESVRAAIRGLRLPFPVAIAASNTMSGSGYKGRNIEDVLWDLANDARRLIDENPTIYFEPGDFEYTEKDGKKNRKINAETAEKAVIRLCEHGILILDEFDKMCLNSVEYGPKDQASFLSVFDGTPIFDSKSIDEDEGKQYETANNLYILTGAFSGLFEKEKKGGIGFIKDTQMTEMNIREKLVDFGLMPELVGRITDIVFTESLSNDEIFKAIMCSKELQQYYMMAEKYGKKLLINEEYVKKIIETRFDLLGVRGVKNILERDYRHALFKSFEDGRDIYIGENYEI